MTSLAVARSAMAPLLASDLTAAAGAAITAAPLVAVIDEAIILLGVLTLITVWRNASP